MPGSLSLISPPCYLNIVRLEIVATEARSNRVMTLWRRGHMIHGILYCLSVNHRRTLVADIGHRRGIGWALWSPIARSCMKRDKIWQYHDGMTWILIVRVQAVRVDTDSTQLGGVLDDSRGLRWIEAHHRCMREP